MYNYITKSTIYQGSFFSRSCLVNNNLSFDTINFFVKKPEQLYSHNVILKVKENMQEIKIVTVKNHHTSFFNVLMK